MRQTGKETDEILMNKQKRTIGSAAERVFRILNSLCFLIGSSAEAEISGQVYQSLKIKNSR
jgi:hypothetical protein